MKSPEARLRPIRIDGTARWKISSCVCDQSAKNLREIVGYLLVDDDEHLYTFPRFTLEEPIEAPFLVLMRGSTEVQLGREPPVVDTAMRAECEFRCARRKKVWN